MYRGSKNNTYMYRFLNNLFKYLNHYVLTIGFNLIDWLYRQQ